MTGEHDVKIYYEDTDSLGIVYYANYLKYFERGRTELFADLGKPVAEWNAEGYNFAVFKAEITWHKPARLGDLCRVVSKLLPSSDFRMKVDQRLFNDGELLTEAMVHIVCLDENMQLREFPEPLLAAATAG